MRKTLLVIAGLTSFVQLATAGDPDPEDLRPKSETARTYEAYENTLLVGIVEKRKLDLNGDAVLDFLVFSNGGEDTFLDVLLANSSGFLVWHMPVAQAYEVVESAGGVLLRLRFDTFSSFGNMWGGDVHGWYDHYQVNGTAMVLRNDGHEEFYRKQRHLYYQRIAELEQLLQEIESECGDNDTCVWMKRDKYNAHLGRYRKFIRKADDLLKPSA